MTQEKENRLYELRGREMKLEHKINGIEKALIYETKDIFLSVEVSGWHQNSCFAVISSQDMDVRGVLELFLTSKRRELEDIKRQINEL